MSLCDILQREFNESAPRSSMMLHREFNTDTAIIIHSTECHY